MGFRLGFGGGCAPCCGGTTPPGTGGAIAVTLTASDYTITGDVIAYDAFGGSSKNRDFNYWFPGSVYSGTFLLTPFSTAVNPLTDFVYYWPHSIGAIGNCECAFLRYQVTNQTTKAGVLTGNLPGFYLPKNTFPTQGYQCSYLKVIPDAGVTFSGGLPSTTTPTALGRGDLIAPKATPRTTTMGWLHDISGPLMNLFDYVAANRNELIYQTLGVPLFLADCLHYNPAGYTTTAVPLFGNAGISGGGSVRAQNILENTVQAGTASVTLNSVTYIP